MNTRFPLFILLLGCYALSAFSYTHSSVRSRNVFGVYIRIGFPSRVSALAAMSDSDEDSAALSSLKKRYDLRIKILEEALFELRDRYKDLAAESKSFPSGDSDGAIIHTLKEEKKKLSSMIYDKDMELDELEKQIELFQIENIDLKQQFERAMEDIRVFRRRTDILENALSDSRIKNEELRNDLKREKATTSTTTGSNLGDIQKELQASQELMEAMDAEYMNEITSLKKFIDKTRETERLDKVHMESIVENAERQLLESKELMEAKDQEIARLKKEFGEIPGKAPDSSKERVRVVRNQSSAAADYMIAGDLRDQRRILEDLSSQIADLKAFQETYSHQLQFGGNAEDFADNSYDYSYDGSSGLGGRVRKAVSRIKRIPVKKGARRLKNAVKKGLVYLFLGMEVDADSTKTLPEPEAAATSSVMLIDEDRRLPCSSEGWERDLNVLLNG